MNNIFLIFGYGVPKDIFKDENYNFYLKMAFNKIYDLTVKKQINQSCYYLQRRDDGLF